MVNLSFRNLVPEESDSIKVSWQLMDIPDGPIMRRIAVLQYIRFMGKKTELWFFGSGLGDQAIVCQIGDAFLKYVKDDDPGLGRLMFSVGIGPFAYHPWKGDLNLYWAWGGVMGDDWLEDYLGKVDIQPDVFLCPSQIIQEHVEDRGHAAIYLPAGVGEVFKPLDLERNGLTYVGGRSKSKEQIDAVTGPYLDSPDFEHHGAYGSQFKTIEELNHFYNEKQIAFGMKLEANDRWGIMSNRVTETIASGTPLVQYGYDAIDETLGFHYPYQTFSRKETVAMVDEILLNYEEHLEIINSYSKIIRKKHNYKVRLKTLFDALEKLK